MNSHEYQAKALLKEFGVPVPKGGVAFTAQEARDQAQKVGAQGPWVVKAQIHAGGRGKAGGVKVVQTLDDVATWAEKMLAMTLVTHQTGPKGQKVSRVYVEEGCAIEKELYLSMLVDRAHECVAIMASTEGGMDIETVAAQTPDKIVTILIQSDLNGHLADFHKIRLAKALQLELTSPAAKQVMELADNLYQAFRQKDMSLLEINPLVINKQGNVVCLDAKVGFDDNALFRHKDVQDLRDTSEEDPAEVEASKYDLNYIRLDGNIACMVNGAGLAMATMDIIKLHGGEPANFLDVGGGATQEKVAAAFRIILSDAHVKGILVNIFGGIMRCDIIAQGVIEAARQVGLSVPLVVRLEGTNVELGKKLMAESGLPIISVDNLDAAAHRIVDVVTKGAH